MSFYTSEQILNQALDSATGTLKTSGPSGAASATAANQTTTNDRLGTPGTGEPAHAGGSTGLIGWARDILAKLAAFGTSAAPSADVLSVQYPNSAVYKDSITPLALYATFTGSTRLVAEGNNYFNARANSDVASVANSVFIEETPDASVNWRVAASGSVWGGGSPLVLRVTKTGDVTYRVRYVNGADAQSWLLITSSQTPT